jgi:lysophospholipase L1-like esterase
LFGVLYFIDAARIPRLRPNGKVEFFHSHISINSKGFRGKEFAEPKGNTYRIVALGESTTFGFTMNPEDKPWPLILEQMIRERLTPDRPVEVINAGIPGNNLSENVNRVRREILLLKPEMIISYHGANGFRFLYEGLPPVRGKSPPVYKRRPMKLLADLEHRLALRDFLKREFAIKSPHPTALPPMETEYARAYRELIQIARTNGIRLVLATYSMAVNVRSPAAAVEFYEEVFPVIRWQVEGNSTHTAIVKQLIQENPEIGYVDTQPNLDGHYEDFIDVMHFAPSGEAQMAETMFGGIRKFLDQDLVPGSSR